MDNKGTEDDLYRDLLADHNNHINIIEVDSSDGDDNVFINLSPIDA